MEAGSIKMQMEIVKNFLDKSEIEIKTGPFGTQLKAAEYQSSGTPVLNVKNLGFSTINTEKLDRVGDATVERLKAHLLKAGDIVFGRKGAVERHAFISVNEEGWMQGSDCIRLRVKTDKINPRFLSYYFLTKEHRAFMISMCSHGTTMASLNQKILEQICFPTPQRNIQDKIVDILERIDRKISLNNRINDNLLQQIVALYEHLINKSDWPIATIAEIAEKIAMGPFGSNIKVSTFVCEGVPIISGNHLRGFFLEEPAFNYISEEHAERLKNSVVFPHDLIFTHAGNIGQVAMIPDRCKYDRYVLSQRQFYLRCDETKVVPEFLLMFFHSEYGQYELLSYANQTGVPSLVQPASNLKKIPFKCPPFQEQLAWQKQTQPLVGAYLNNRLENEKLTALRDGLLPKLMSGELDVSTLDI